MTSMGLRVNSTARRKLADGDMRGVPVSEQPVVHPPVVLPMNAPPPRDSTGDSIRQLLHNLRGLPTPMGNPDRPPQEQPTKSVLRR